MTTPNAASFENVVSAWDEPLRCQSVYGCLRRAAWLALNHKPCGGQKPICTAHYRRWLTECLKIVAQHGGLACGDCDQDFTTIDQCTHFRPL